MSRSFLRRMAPSTRLTAATILLMLGLAACASDTTPDEPAPAAEELVDEDADDEDAAGDVAEDDPDAGGTDVAGEEGEFPATVVHDGGEVTIEDVPERIVSLSPTATEMLFAIGAGDQVVAVDEFSTFPEEAPTTDLSGFNPNLEAILEYDPDLVVVQNDSNDLVAGLTETDVTVLQFDAATDLTSAFSQFEALGAATGNDAEQVVTEIRQELGEISASADVENGLTYYHELSADLFSATSATFIGEIYGLFDMRNIADEADSDNIGYPQLSKEYVVEQDPDYVFLACTVFCGETAETFCSREGFGDLTACAEGNVIELDDDIASRWGPRTVDFAATVAGALQDG